MGGAEKRDGPGEDLPVHRGGGVVPVERRGRLHQLPAEPEHRRGGAGGERPLPHHRVPGAPGPLRLVRRQRGHRRIRHGPGRLSGPVRLLRRPAGGGERADRRFSGPRRRAHGGPCPGRDPGPRGGAEPPFRAGLRQESPGGEIPLPRRDPQGRRPPRDGKILLPPEGGGGPGGAAGLLGGAAGRLPPGVRGQEAGDHGQHLAPVSVHGHLQHEPLRQLLRVGHRAGHGLPGQLPGPAGVRPHVPGPGPGADHRHRLDPVPRRVHLSPVPAPHQAGQRRRGQRLQRRPPVAGGLHLRLHRRDRGPDHPGPPRPLRQPPRLRGAADGASAPERAVHHDPSGSPRPAPHRPGGLERLPEPELLLRGARGELPDHGAQRGAGSGERVHRGHVRAVRTAVRPAVPGAGPRRGGGAGGGGRRTDGGDPQGPRLGRGVVRPGL